MSSLSLQLRHGRADLAEVRLHYVEIGDGPLVVLLHGFPDFWYGWRHQLPALARAGFRVVAPDMRGYNRSSRPAVVSAYGMGRLAADVRDLVHERGADRGHLAGHDWGAAVAWATAGLYPDVVRRLAILNLPHPRRLAQGLRTWPQMRRSWYMLFFQLPRVPEHVVSANSWWALRQLFMHDARPGAFTEQDIERYMEAWSHPGATSAMLNYYRAAFRASPMRAQRRPPRVDAETLVIWGERDRHLSADLAEPDPADVPHLQRVVRLPEASHWVAQDEPDEVSRLLAEFFSEG